MANSCQIFLQSTAIFRVFVRFSSSVSARIRVNTEHRILQHTLSSTRSPDSRYDVVVVGGGIIGMATARELIHRHPNLLFALVEKEQQLAYHQSGRNSGVVHGGIYYQPGSLRAKLCVDGMKLMYDYCDQHGVPYKKCGKLIVATDKIEESRLDSLYERALQNNVPGIRLVDSDEIRQIEPNCVGVKAIHSPETGIIDYVKVVNSYADDFTSRGGEVYTSYKVSGFHETPDDSEYPLTVVQGADNQPSLKCKYVVTCGGLYSDVLAKLSGCPGDPKIVPFRGDYLLLKPEKENLVNGNIYPVPDPKLPFLGVHFTPRMDGRVWLGPNAVLAFKREGYSLGQINRRELMESLCYRGLQKLLCRHSKAGMGELYRMLSLSAQVKQLQKFVPSLQVSDVIRGPSGVRAQALDPSGNLVDDFITDHGHAEGVLGSRILHVRNAPSPAATSSLAFAKMVADRVDESFNFPPR